MPGNAQPTTRRAVHHARRIWITSPGHEAIKPSPTDKPRHQPQPAKTTTPTPLTNCAAAEQAVDQILADPGDEPHPGADVNGHCCLPPAAVEECSILLLKEG
jgi:hypothetical protein